MSEYFSEVYVGNYGFWDFYIVIGQSLYPTLAQEL